MFKYRQVVTLIGNNMYRERTDAGSIGPYLAEKQKEPGIRERIKSNVQKYPIQTGSLLGRYAGAYGAAGTIAPYALTVGSAAYTLGTIGIGALLGGILGLTVTGLLYWGWFRGRRKKDPQYDPKQGRSAIKQLLDYMDEMNELAKQREAKQRETNPSPTPALAYAAV